MDTILEAFADKLIIPIIAVLGTALVVIIQGFTSRIAKSIELNNRLSDIEKEAAIRERLLSILGQAVQSAVGSNMQLAESMKESGKLTPEQIKQLQDSAKQRVWNSLPPTLLNEESITKILGGRDQINELISTMIEQYVYEYKMKSSATTTIITEATRAVQPSKNDYRKKKK